MNSNTKNQSNEAEEGGVATTAIGEPAPEVKESGGDLGDVPDPDVRDLHAPPKKYSSYDLKVDPEQDDRALEIKLRTFKRPHMRAFHFSWWGFFIAFFIWFSAAPLLPTIRDTLELSNADIWTSNIFAVTFDIIMRFILGAQCDKYGARLIMGLLLCVAAIPTALTGTAQSLAHLIVIRLFIGIAGSTFVCCQYWSTCMFTKEKVGIANGLVGGWGNCGGGVTQIVMGTLLFPLFREYVYDGNEEKAWRTVCVIPAFVAFMTGLTIIKFSDDCPKGNYSKLKKTGEMPEISAAASFRSGAVNFNTWILYIQYACCFGVELTMNNAAATYFVDTFGLSIASASAIASVFGFMNIFARGVGGHCSDLFMGKMGMRGRILVQGLLLLIEGVLILVFASTQILWLSIVLMTLFSIMVQAAEGSTYGIVPYVNPSAAGAVAGIVGAGGPSGAVLFGLGFRQLEPMQNAYYLMGGIVIFSSFLSLLITIKGHRGMLFGKDQDLKLLSLPVGLGDVEEDVEEDEQEKQKEEEGALNTQETTEDSTTANV